MRPYRTVLEQKIRERRQTYEEFAEYVEAFAREHKEPGTLGVRHLQRLAAGRGLGGKPLGRVLPTTARLLEQILGVSIDVLLAAPPGATSFDESENELQQRIYASSQVDETMLAILADQLNGIRRLDRQLGAVVAQDEVLAKVTQITELLTYSLSTTVRERLAALLSELHCLAGWQALDLGQISDSWRHYSNAVTTGQLSGATSYLALANAGRAVVLTEVGQTRDAVEIMIGNTDAIVNQNCSALLRSWLAAAAGEALSANGQQTESLRMFDRAADLLPHASTNAGTPYVALDSVHLARWRGHALAQCGDMQAVAVLTDALAGLDSTFARAETALRVDLTIAFYKINEVAEARTQARSAEQLAARVGSIRQTRRLAMIRTRYATLDGPL
jgi:hypothetical protein